MTHPYATRQYAEIAAGDDNEIVEVSDWNQWVVMRSIETRSNGPSGDVAGCYPLSTFDADVDLEAGLETLRSLGCVSMVMVVDPVLRPDDDRLTAAFDICRPFKTHYLYERQKGAPHYSKHHRYEVRRARADIVQIDLEEHIDEWVSLYGQLVQRHKITGSAAYSERALRDMSRIEGLVAFGAFVGGSMVACHLWLEFGRIVHSHLAASNAEGRRCGAAYLLYDAAIRHFGDAELIDFGGGAGLGDDPNDGLARFKRGFANHAVPAYLCGKVLDRTQYGMLCTAAGSPESSEFFPAYRAPSCHVSLKGGV